MKYSQKFFEQFIYLFFYILGLTPLRMGRKIGAGLGRLAYHLDGRHRQVAVSNLTRAFSGEKTAGEIERLAKAVFENIGMTAFEVCWALHLPLDKLKSFFRVVGASHMKTAYHEGRGVLALTGHFGNWELLSVAGAILGFPLHVVVRPLDFTPLDTVVENIRSRFGAGMIHRRKALRKIIHFIREGHMIAMLLDQSVDWYDGFFVDFFGRTACTNKAMARISLKTGAPVIPSFLFRRPDGFSVHFFPPIHPVNTRDPIGDAEALTARYNLAIEKTVRMAPEQWFWVHRRWKTAVSHPWPRRQS